MSSTHTDSKRRRKANFEDIDEAMNTWFLQVRSTNLPVSGPMVREKAMKLAADLGYQDFKASEGWLARFRNRHNIVFRTVSGEANAAPQETISEWKEKLPSLLQNYDERDIFNLDETGLFLNYSQKEPLQLKVIAAMEGNGVKNV